MTAVYDVHGVELVVHAADAAVRDAVDRRLRHFRTARAASPGSLAIRLRTGISPTDAPGPSTAGRPVYDTPEGPVIYDETTDVLSLDYGGRARLLIEGGSGRTALDSAGNGREDVWLLSHPLLTIAVFELLKRRARYPLHAAAMEAAGAVLVLAGTSGAGKTTLAIALSRQGWAFLADDTVFLTSPRHGPTILAFPDEIDVSQATVELFADLGPLARVAPLGGRDKHALLAEEALGAVARRTSGRAAAVVFPAVADHDESILTRLDPSEALVELAPNVLLTEPVSSQAHFDALAALAVGVPCFRLATGRDFQRLAELLRGLVTKGPARLH